MSGVVPASATEVFRNERRERSSGVMAAMDRHDSLLVFLLGRLAEPPLH